MALALDGKVTLITGAGSGIGRAAALAAAREGARVLVSDVSERGGEETAAAVRAAGGEARFRRCDVTRQEDVDALVRTAVEAWGRLDGAFNNAGIEGRLVSAVDYPEELFERVVAVNLVGVWRCMRAEIPAMVKGGGGAIVNTASVAGLVGAGLFSAYVASKHGVVGLSKSTALEVARQGVRVNVVCPGVIQTPMLDRLAGEMPEAVAALAGISPIGRVGTAEEVAETVVFLLSGAAAFVTGATLAVDGGFTAQ